MVVKMIFRIIFTWILISLVTVSNARSNIIDNPDILYSLDNLELNDPDILDTKITIKHKFNNINELINEINSVNNLSAKLVSQSAVKVDPVYIYLDSGTLTDLLNQTSSKLGYKWKFQDKVVLFNAISPIIPKPIVAGNNVVWSMAPKDKTLRGAFTKWCNIKSWQLVWNVKADYPIDTAWAISGSFESAVNEVLKATQHTEMPLMAVMHDSNHVLEIYSPVTSR